MKAANEVIALCLMMAFGIYGRKKAFIDDKVEKGLNSMLVNMILPMSIINSFCMEYDPNIIDNCKKLIIFSLIIHTLCLVLSKFIFFKTEKKKQAVFRFMVTFSNCAFMGFPILGSIYGDIGIFYASIFNIVFHIYAWTFGVALFNTDMPLKESMKNIIKNKAIWSVIIGAFIFVFQIQLPSSIGSVVKNVASITTPLSMIIIGSMLCSSNIKDVLKDYSLYVVSLIRLVLIPLIIFIVMNLFNIDKILIAVPTLIMAMPGAAICPVIANANDGDGQLASKCIFMTNILSVITIPIFMNLVA